MTLPGRGKPRKSMNLIAMVILLLWAVLGVSCGDSGPTTAATPEDASALPAEPGPADQTFMAEVDNPLFPLDRGMRWEYAVETPEGTVDQLVAEVTDEKRTVAGVTTTTLRVTLLVDGELEEETFSWFAQDAAGNVWLFGEIDHGYEEGSLVETTTWQADVDGAEAGIVVQADPLVGDEYRVGFVEGTMEEMARIVDLDGIAEVEAGSFADLLVIENWSLLEPDVIEQKFYARGIGLVYQTSDSPDTDVVELISFAR